MQDKSEKPITSRRVQGVSSSLLPVVLLAIGTFAMGTDSFVLAGILPQLNQAFHISAGTSGQTVTIFALTYAVLAPFLAVFTSHIGRKKLLLIALFIFVAANVASASAQNFASLLVTRVLAALGAALFTPTASAAALALADRKRHGIALSIILGGLTVGTVLGVPLGTALGQQFTWRASLWFIAAVGLVALLCIATSLRRTLSPAQTNSIPERISVFRHPQAIKMVLFMVLASAASISVYTYIAEVVQDSAGISGSPLAYILLAWGIGGSVGSFSSGMITDRYGANRTLLIALGLLLVSFTMLAFASSTLLIFVTVCINGIASWSFAAPNNYRLTRIPGLHASTAISFNSSGIYFGQAVGAMIGGIYLAQRFTPRLLPVAGIAITLIALGMQLHVMFKRA